jgi:hypothetical protein
LRAIDEPIPGPERLIRTIRPDNIDGDRIRETAIDLQGMSVSREKYLARLEDAFSAMRPDETVLAAVTAGSLPGPVGVGDPPVVQYEFCAKDLPEEGNDPHAEIRPRRVSTRPQCEVQSPGSKTSRRILRNALAEQFRVIDLVSEAEA